MSTVLIDTSGGSKFQEGTQLLDMGKEDNVLKQLGIQLTDTDARPLLKPTSKVIDVVNDFSWYAGPKATSAALNKVPCVFLTEREQLLSSLISGGLYYLNNAARAVDTFAQSGFIKSLLGDAQKGGNVEKFIKGGQAAARKTFESVQAAATGTESDRLLLNQHNLKSLEGIYFTKPTDFHYRLPLYSQPSTPLSPGYGEGSGENFVQGAVDMGVDIVRNISSAVNFAQPGTYIEEPKYFEGIGTRTETIDFPLSNTVRRGTVSPIQQNYELLWLLAFQNTPYKTSFSRTPPPKIYSVQVPGQFSMPYAYISGMSVGFVGTVRKTSVVVPSGNGTGVVGSKVIQTPVPEAYQVSISFTSLIGEYGNTMISDGFSTSINDNIVRIGK